MTKNIFQPDLYIEDIRDLDTVYFINKGFKNVLIDLDNTLAPYYQERIDERALNILDKLKDEGFEVIVISNNHGTRVKKFLEDTDYKWLNFALKPTKIGYKRLIKAYNLKKEETLTVGDQILTDIIGANRMGIYSILVKPLVTKDSLSTRFNRIFERILINKGIVKLK